MSKPKRNGPITFFVNGAKYKATGIIAVVQKSQDTVEVRYGDGSNPLVIRNTTAMSVIAAVDKAKGLRR